jgi:hypothetical protein
LPRQLLNSGDKFFSEKISQDLNGYCLGKFWKNKCTYIIGSLFAPQLIQQKSNFWDLFQKVLELQEIAKRTAPRTEQKNLRKIHFSPGSYPESTLQKANSMV